MREDQAPALDVDDARAHRTAHEARRRAAGRRPDEEAALRVVARSAARAGGRACRLACSACMRSTTLVGGLRPAGGAATARPSTLRSMAASSASR